ncbi:MAG: hypothetical protein K2W95_07430 [Candidatus Obscuribacterales bacterium]|nr:hypothetical protein [Candidatus Obscuribacterales bacterium]
MTELATMEQIANDIEARASVEAATVAALATLTPSETKSAITAMSMSNSESPLPGLTLVGDDIAAYSGDALHPADINVGGYNAGIGAQVPAQAEGVKTRLGKVYDKSLESGWNWKLPLLDTVIMMPTSTIADTVRAQAVSHDLQQVTTELTVPFHMRKGYGPQVYAKIGTLEKVEGVIINPGVLECLKAVTARYTAEELITKRETVKNEVEDHLKTYVHGALKQRGIEDAIEIGKLALTDFRFSDEYNRSIELKVKAAQDALRAESEKKQRITEAEGIRESSKAKSEGEAFAIELKGKAEAKAIDVKSQAEAGAILRRAEALRANKDLINLNAVEKWDGKLPSVTSGGVVPFLNIDAIKHAPEK